LKHQKCKELLFKVLAGQPDSELQADGGKQPDWAQEQKEAVQINYKILGEVFSVSGGLELREKALACGLLPRILERLAAISGEKPRVYEEQEDEPAEQDKSGQEQSQGDTEKKAEPEKNTEKKKRKGVGYGASKQGQAFDVSAYLENTKQRNEQIKTLVDICSNFLGSKEWVPLTKLPAQSYAVPCSLSSSKPSGTARGSTWPRRQKSTRPTLPWLAP